MVLAICDNCGKKVSQKKQRFDKNVHNFCDKKCYAEWMRKNPEFCRERQQKGWWKGRDEKDEMHKKWKQRREKSKKEEY